jgi:hypothetical protein
MWNEEKNAIIIGIWTNGGIFWLIKSQEANRR